MQSNERIISDFIESGTIKSLALFHKLKSLHRNSVLYDIQNKSKRKELSRQCGIDPRTFDKRLNHLLEYSFSYSNKETMRFPIAEITGGNLYLHKIRPIKHLCTIRVKRDSTLKEIEAYLYEKIINAEYRRQLYRIDQKKKDKLFLARVKSPTAKISKQEYEKYLRKGKACETSITDDICANVGHLSYVINVSEGKLRSVIGTLKDKGRISYVKRQTKLRKCPREAFFLNEDCFSGFSGYLFWHLGSVYERKANLIRFREFGIGGSLHRY